MVGYDSVGRERARIGGLARPAHPPHSKAEAVAQGDPAGFAPTTPPPSSYTYKGKDISEAEAARLELVCLEGREVARCYDSAAGMEEAQGARHRGP